MIHKLIHAQEHEVEARVDANREFSCEAEASAVAELQILHHRELQALIHRHAIEGVEDSRPIVGNALAYEHRALVLREHQHGFVDGFGEVHQKPLLFDNDW